MDVFTKYSAEKRWFEVDFVDDLDHGDSLIGVPTVTTDIPGLAVDPGTISKNGTTVRFRLSGGTAGARGHLVCTCPTTGVEDIIAKPPLRVLA